MIYMYVYRMYTAIKEMLFVNQIPFLNVFPASARPCLAEFNFTSMYENESTENAEPSSLQRGPSDLKLFYQTVQTTVIALLHHNS
jgi:hypothetical protein